MATRAEIMERLQRVQGDSRLWEAISRVLDEWDELHSLLWIKDHMRDYGNSIGAERLEELERRFEP